MRWKSLCAVVTASFALLANEAMSEQGEPTDRDRQAYASHRTRLTTTKAIYDSAPRNSDPNLIARMIKSASVSNSECADLTSIGYKRLGRLVKNSLAYDTADCTMPAVGMNKFAVYGDPHDIFVYTEGPNKGRFVKEREGKRIVFDGERPFIETDGTFLEYERDPYEDDRLRLDGVEGAGEGFGSSIMYRNRFGDQIFFSMIEGRTSHFSIWPIDRWLQPTYFQRQCDGSFTKVSQPLPLHCDEE